MSVANPRVQIGINYVHQEVGGDVNAGEENYHRLHHLKVFGPQRVNRKLPHSGIAKNGFNDHRTGHRPPQYQTEIGNRRNQGVA